MSVTTKKTLPQANGDFYAILATVSEEDQALLRRVRAFLEAEVAPIFQSLLDPRGISPSDHSGAGGASHRGPCLSRIWLPWQEHGAGWLAGDGTCTR